MRIAIDARPALWQRTGIGTVCFNVIKRIEAIDPDNEYFYYFDSDPAPLQEIARLSNCRYGSISTKLLWANYFVPRQARRDGIDLFISFLEKDVPLFGKTFKLATLIHDLIPLRLDYVFKHVFHKLYYLTLMNLASSRADLIMTISEHSKRDIQELLRARKEKLRVITWGVEQLDGTADLLALKEKRALPKNYVLCVGSTEPRKNNVNVIKAFRIAAEQDDSLHLVITGAPWRGELFPAELLDGKIIQLGYVSDAEMRGLYAGAKVFLYPSLYEGFGLPILEAMVQGTPVITSNTCSMPEVAGDAALYADPGDVNDIASKLAILLETDRLRTALGERGRARAANFTWEKTCLQMIETYRSIEVPTARKWGRV